MSVTLNYYILLKEGVYAELQQVKPETSVADIRGSIFDWQRSLFRDRYDYDIAESSLQLYESKGLKYEEDGDEKELHDRVKKSIVGLQPLKSTARIRPASGENFIHLVVVPPPPHEITQPLKRRRLDGEVEVVVSKVPARSPAEITRLEHGKNVETDYDRIATSLYDFLWKKEENWEKIVVTTNEEVPNEVPAGPSGKGGSSRAGIREPTRPVTARMPFLIRDEYRELDAFLDENKTKHVIVLGQPGIGKTVYLIYYLTRRLTWGYPTLLVLGHTCSYLFQDSGAYWAPVDAFINNRQNLIDNSHPERLVLFELNDELKKPLNNMRDWNVLLATLPQYSRYGRWQKDLAGRVERFIMKTWQWTELYLSREMATTRRDLHGWRIAFLRYGGSARKLLATNVKDLDPDIERAITNCHDINLLVNPVDMDFREDVSHALVEINPLVDENGKLDRALATGQIISSYILELILIKLREQIANSMCNIFEELVGRKATRSAASIVFEGAGHRYIFRSRKEKHKLRPLDRLLRKTSALRLPHVDNVNDFTDDSLTMLDPKCYYRPLSGNLSGIDSFVIETKGRSNDITGVVMFQFTVGDERPINSGFLETLWEKCVSETNRRSQGNWKFVFVVPNNMESGFKKQKWTPSKDADIWDKRVNQYVLGVDESDVWNALRLGYH